MPRFRGLPARLVLASFAMLVSASLTFAQPAREKGDWSLSLGLLSEPTPSVVSAGGSYHLTPNLRLDGGVGGGVAPNFMLSIEWAIYGAGLTYLVSPEKPFTPAIGAGVHYVRLEYTPVLLSIFGMKKEIQDTVTLSLDAGFDWQTRSGFLLAFGGTGWVDLGDTALRDYGGIPFLRLGWTF